MKRCEGSSSRVSRRTLEVWLHERGAVVVSFNGSPPRLHHQSIPRLPRAGRIDRQQSVAELRTRYCVNSSETILRALLAPEPDKALEALRQLPRFGSVLGDLMRNHIALMRTRGFRYDTNTRMFLRFDRFLQRHPELARSRCRSCCSIGRRHVRRPSMPPIANCCDVPWPGCGIISIPAFGGADTAAGPSSEQRQVRSASGVGPTSIAPKRSGFCWTSLVPIHRRVRRSARSRFIRCWRSVYCAGLRVSEIARLSLGDVDLQVGTITIRETKFFKSRILPLADKRHRRTP